MQSSQTQKSTDATSTEWSRSPRGRTELVAIILFCAAVLIIPPCLQVVHPLSAATMFSSRVEKFCVYEVFDSDGNELSIERFGLHLHNPHNAAVRRSGGVGEESQSRFSMQTYGIVAPREVVVKQVRQILAKSSTPRFVFVAQKVIGAKDARHVGIVQAKIWKVTNPRYDDADVSQTPQNLPLGS